MMSEEPVAGVVNRRFYAVDTEDTLSYCQGIFREHHPRALVVLDRGKKFAGMLSEREIVRSLMDPTKTKVRGIYRRAPHISPGQSVGEAARLMVESDVKYLPALEGGRIVGLVTDDAILRIVSTAPYGRTRVKEVMTKELVTISAEDSIAKAVSLMRNEGISRLPVLKDGRPVGIVTLYDILGEVYGPRDRMPGRVKGRGQMGKPLRDPISDIMSSPVVTASPEDTISSAISSMLRFDISSLVVTAPSGGLLGLVTKTDLLRPVAGTTDLGPSIKLEISVKDRDGVEELDRARLAFMLQAFARKHEKMLGGSVVSIFLKRHGSQKSGPALVHCRVMASGPSGQFSAVGEGRGSSAAIKEALKNLERRVIRAKEIASSGQYSARFLADTADLLG